MAYVFELPNANDNPYDGLTASDNPANAYDGNDSTFATFFNTTSGEEDATRYRSPVHTTSSADLVLIGVRIRYRFTLSFNLGASGQCYIKLQRPVDTDFYTLVLNTSDQSDTTRHIFLPPEKRQPFATTYLVFGLSLCSTGTNSGRLYEANFIWAPRGETVVVEG